MSLIDDPLAFLTSSGDIKFLPAKNLTKKMTQSQTLSALRNNIKQSSLVEKF
jgi:hypothetical protein